MNRLPRTKRKFKYKDSSQMMRDHKYHKWEATATLTIKLDYIRQNDIPTTEQKA